MPVLTELDKTEDALRKCLHRAELLETNLKRQGMPMEERERLEEELDSVQKLLKTHEKELESLRKDNRLTSAIAVLLLICCFLFYGTYSMFFKQ